ncbi:MAG: hypothetical protein [Caudoviricetes sp.]|nr:MAG: hypothetical protein [Caudoviricetes sp.]
MTVISNIVLGCHCFHRIFELCFFLETGEVAAPPASSLAANGDCHSPFAEPDLEAEFKTHGRLLCPPKHYCFGEFFMPRFSWYCNR